MDSMYAFLFLLLAATSSSLLSRISAASPSPPPPPQIFHVLSYGAVGDGAADDSKPFRAAWDAACQAERPAVVLVPRHYTFMIRSAFFPGPCRNPLTFQIEGSLMPAEGPESWPENYNKRTWLVFYRIKGMTMQGGGIIDGRGQKWWDLPCKPRRYVNGTTVRPPGPCDSPTAMRFVWSSNLIIRDLEMKNSPLIHIRFNRCQNVDVDSLYINSPADSPNTDGIHLEKSKNFTIYNSVIATGDDCVSIGDRTFNVDIRNITCDHTHGISIGSLGSKNSSACVSNITVRDSVIKRSDNGARIKTWRGGYGTVSSISFTNIEMDAVRNPIIIDQYYCNGGTSCSNHTKSAVHITGISYAGIRGTYDAGAPPINLACSDAVPCTNLTVSDVELLPAQAQAQGRAMVDPFCWNAYGDGGAVNVPLLPCLIPGEPSFVPANRVSQCSTVGSGSGTAVRGVEPGRQPKAGNMSGLSSMYIVDILLLHFSFFIFLSIAFWAVLNFAPGLLFIPSHLLRK